MPRYPLRALVLRKTKLGETDAIVALLSSEGKNVRAVGKGMRKPGSKVGGRMEPFSLVDLLLYAGRSLDTIVEAETVEVHRGIRNDYDRSTAAAVVVDVLDKLSVEGLGEPRLYGLGLASLAAIEKAPAENLEALLVGFLVKAMAMHGHRPVLGSCAGCACDTLHPSDQRFSLAEGGMLCGACKPRFHDTAGISLEARLLLERLFRMTMQQIGSEAAGTDSRHVAESFKLMQAFVKYHVPARIKALDYYARPTDAF